MAELNSILKFRKSSRKEFASIRLRENPIFNLAQDFKIVLAILFCASLLACAERVQRSAPPEQKLLNPSEFLTGPLDPEFQKAYQQYLQGYYAESRSRLKKILNNDASHFPAMLTMAYTYIAENNNPLAEQYIRQALEVTPDYAQAHFALAHIMERQNDYQGALAELNEVTRLKPDYPELEQIRNIFTLKATEYYLTRGRHLVETDPDEAIRFFEAAAALAPEIHQIPMEIAQVHLKQKRCSEAMMYLEKLEGELPQDPEAQLNLADCLVDAGQEDRALEIYQKLAAVKRDDPELRNKIDAVQKRLAFRVMPEEFQVIASTEKVNRAQLAALLITNLEFLQKYAASRSQIITDTLNHWAHNYIRKVVDLGMMDIFPNRTFQPNRSITKLELARAGSRVLEILERNEGRPLPAAGREPIAIPDISPANVYYAMIAKALSADVVSLDADGYFHPGRGVSGAEALSMVNRLKVLSE